MDPKIVEQVASKIAENLNGITDSIRSISEAALAQYVTAQYTFGFIFMGLSIILIFAFVVCIVYAHKFDKKNMDGASMGCIIGSIFVALLFMSSVAICLQSFYYAMSPITVLLLGK